MRDKYNVRKIADSYKFDESYEINIYFSSLQTARYSDKL